MTQAQGKMNAKQYMDYMAAGAEVTLPSGLVVHVKPVNSDLLLRGKYPDALMEVIRKNLLGSNTGKSAEEVGKDLDEQGKLMETYDATIEWLHLVARNAIISPKLVEQADYTGADDEIPMDALARDDFYWLGGLLDVPLSRLFSVCKQQNDAMERLFNGESNPSDARSAPEPAPDNPRLDGEQPVSAVPVDERVDHDQRVVDNVPI